MTHSSRTTAKISQISKHLFDPFQRTIASVDTFQDITLIHFKTHGLDFAYVNMSILDIEATKVIFLIDQYL